uniref:Uncharacterized protein n=1 Tax=Cacopsylla melanoneura TaxID=428564 RepID=A0A8D8RSY6_9HEMI
MNFCCAELSEQFFFARIFFSPSNTSLFSLPFLVSLSSLFSPFTFLFSSVFSPSFLFSPFTFLFAHSLRSSLPFLPFSLPLFPLLHSSLPFLPLSSLFSLHFILFYPPTLLLSSLSLPLFPRMNV